MATPEFKVTGRITNVERVGTSTNGNPTHAITIRTPDGSTSTYRTETDGSVGYGAQNYHPHSQEHGSPRENTLTVRGKRERVVAIDGPTRAEALQALRSRPKLLGGVHRRDGVAGSVAYTVRVQYPGEAPMRVTFTGSLYGAPGPVFMSFGEFRDVRVGEPERFGDRFSAAWVRAFYGAPNG